MKVKTVLLAFYSDEMPDMTFVDASFQFRQGGPCNYVVVFQETLGKVTYFRQEDVRSIIVQS